MHLLVPGFQDVNFWELAFRIAQQKFLLFEITRFFIPIIPQKYAVNFALFLRKQDGKHPPSLTPLPVAAKKIFPDIILRLFCNLLPLLQQFLFYPLQGLLQHINGNWFQQIFLYAQAHCLPGIFKLRIAADNDAAYLFPFLVEKSQHFQPIHIIHAYICNH